MTSRLFLRYIYSSELSERARPIYKEQRAPSCYIILVIGGVGGLPGIRQQL